MKRYVQIMLAGLLFCGLVLGESPVTAAAGNYRSRSTTTQSPTATAAARNYASRSTATQSPTVTAQPVPKGYNMLKETNNGTPRSNYGQLGEKPAMTAPVYFVMAPKGHPSEERQESRFVVALTDPVDIATARSQLNGNNSQIIGGELRSGDGGYNFPWSWHLDSDTIEFSQAAIELCSGLPMHLENDLEYWLKTVGMYCPWGLQVVAEGREKEAYFSGVVELVSYSDETQTRYRLTWDADGNLDKPKYFWTILPNTNDIVIIPGPLAYYGTLEKTISGSGLLLRGTRYQ